MSNDADAEWLAIQERIRAVTKITAEGKATVSSVIAAVNSEMNRLDPDSDVYKMLAQVKVMLRTGKYNGEIRRGKKG